MTTTSAIGAALQAASGQSQQLRRARAEPGNQLQRRERLPAIYVPFQDAAERGFQPHNAERRRFERLLLFESGMRRVVGGDAVDIASD
jgi:hypothetical protein